MKYTVLISWADYEDFEAEDEDEAIEKALEWAYSKEAGDKIEQFNADAIIIEDDSQELSGGFVTEAAAEAEVMRITQDKMMTFEEACEKDRDELVNVFEIETADNICQGCIHLCDCPACVQFHNEQPSDSISACKFYEA